MADEQRGEILIHGDIGEVGIKMGVDDIVDKEIKEKHNDFGKGGGNDRLSVGRTFLNSEGHNRRIHDCPPLSPWGDHELNTC